MNKLQLELENVKNKISPAYGRYISVDEGWYQLVVDCDKELTAIDPDYQILQIKEKFGGLRYYMTPSSNITEEQKDKMYEVISRYEAKAAQTCEATGKPGVLMRSIGGWYRTLNPEYAATTQHYARYSVVDDPPSDDDWAYAIK